MAQCDFRGRKRGCMLMCACAMRRPYVLPDKYVVPLTDSELGIQMPKGILFVHLLEAEHVPRMDLLGKSDPYCM